jgi:hypothetical protein
LTSGEQATRAAQGWGKGLLVAAKMMEHLEAMLY